MAQGRKKSGRSNWKAFNEARAKRRHEKRSLADRAQQPSNWCPERRLYGKTSMAEMKRELRSKRVFKALVDQETQTVLSLPADKLVTQVTVTPAVSQDKIDQLASDPAGSQDKIDQLASDPAGSHREGSTAKDAEMERQKMEQFLLSVEEEWGLNNDESVCEGDLDLLSVKEEEDDECGVNNDSGCEAELEVDPLRCESSETVSDL